MISIISKGILASASKIDPLAQAYFNAVGDLTTGLYTNADAQAAINRFVRDRRQLGLLRRDVAQYLFVGNDPSQFKWNLMNAQDTDLAYRLSFDGTPGGYTYASTGIKANGTDNFANTFINCNQAFPSYSFTGSYYGRDTVAVGVDDYFLFGCRGTGSAIVLDTFSIDRLYGSVAMSFENGSPVQTVGFGLSSFKRLMGITTLSFNSQELYQDTTLLDSNYLEHFGYFPSQDPNNPQTMYLFASNENGTPFFFSNNECAYAGFSYGMNNGLWLMHNQTVNNLQTDLNRNV